MHYIQCDRGDNMGFNKASRTENTKKNIVSSIGNKIVLLLLTFISRRLFIHYIGVEHLGINSLFSNVLTLLSMADMGIGTAMNVSLYKPIAEEDTKKIAALLNYFRCVYRIIAAAVFGIGVSLVPFLKYIVNLDTNIEHLYLYYIIFVIKTAASYLYAYKTSLVKADQKMYIVNRVEIYVNLSKILGQIVVICFWKDYLLYILLEVVGVIVTNVLVSKKADNQYPFINETIELKKDEKKVLFSDISSVFLYKISWSLLNGTDNIIISILLGTVYVGLYTNYYTITSSVELLIGLLFGSITASIGNLVATASAEKRFATFKVMQMVSFWMCGVVCVCLFCLTQDFIGLWVGKDLQLDQLTLIAIVCNVFFSICMRPVWTFREGTGMYKQIRYIMFVTAILNLTLSIIMGKFLGLSGVIFATSLSKILTYFWYEPNILFHNFFKTSSINYYISYLKNIGLLGVALVFGFLCCNVISGDTYLGWAVKTTICFMSVNLVYYLKYRKTKEYSEIKNKIQNMLCG